MFQKGEYVIHGSNGVCVVEDITHLTIPGSDKRRLYHVLQPLAAQGSKIYSPVDNSKVLIRHILSKEEAEILLNEFSEIEPLEIQSEKLREEVYKKVMKACDFRQWISMMKALYLKRDRRMAQGRKVTAVDERYLKAAEELICSELSLVFGLELEETRKRIFERLRKIN